MSLTLDQAIVVAERQLASCNLDGVPLKLLSGKTEEFDVGWVFYYQSARFIETGDFCDPVAGNRPLFVSRSDGIPCFVSYHRSLAESLTAYRACGNANAQEIPVVRLTGWREGALSVSAIQAIRQHSAVGLAQAKSAVESCLANQSKTVPVRSVAEARALVLALSSSGFEAQVCYES
jgi:hypothetical protein